jgi:hypothetical protein
LTGRFWKPATPNKQQKQTGIQMKSKILSIAVYRLPATATDIGKMKTMKLLMVAGIACAAVLFTGCASNRTELTSPSTQTAVNLSQNNFRIIKAGAIGTSHGFRLLGIIPFAGANETQARANLYQNLGKSLEGKSATLANTTYAKSTIYLILFSVPKVTVEADVVEYISVPPASSPAAH